MKPVRKAGEAIDQILDIVEAYSSSAEFMGFEPAVKLLLEEIGFKLTAFRAVAVHGASRETEQLWRDKCRLKAMIAREDADRATVAERRTQLLAFAELLSRRAGQP